MLFNSIEFLIFFPIVVLLYFIMPKRFRQFYLLICSYYFYMCWNAKYAILLFFSTFVTYIIGLLVGIISKEETDRKKLFLRKVFVGFGFTLNLSILFFFKYMDFLISNLNIALGNMGAPLIHIPFDIVLPVGISFYIFQALGYTIDVYRGDLKAEKNLIKYAVFVSFFPQLVAGPIERSANLLNQFDETHKFDFERAKNGILLMLWGFFQKVIIADRITMLVDNIYNHPQYYEGFAIAIATVFFAFQVYCDFAGYTNIARGASQIMGFRLINNFDSPYFARSVAEFWRRWHISLSTWFRDYLYFPLGGSRNGNKKSCRNIMIVFLVSGIWHGASWTFVIWGALNGLYQVFGKIFAPVRKKVYQKFNVNEDAFSHKLMQTIFTFCLVDFAWIFFRAQDLKTAFLIIERMFTSFNPWIFFDETLWQLGLTQQEFMIGILAIIVLLVVDYWHYKGKQLRQILSQQGIWFRWSCYISAIFIILIFGIYGPGFDANQFIYFQF